MTFYVLSFLCYLIILLGISFWSRKKTQSAEDYVSGGRSLNYWVTALSAHASDMSSWLFMAYPMMIYTRGIDALWVPFGLVLGMFICWKIFAKKLRLASQQYNTLTIYSFFAKKFSDNKKHMTFLLAGLSIVYLGVYIVSGLIGMGLLLESLFAIDYYKGLTLCMIAVLLYTTIGGFITVCYTDAFQAVFLILALLLVVVFSFTTADISTLGSIISEKNLSLSLFHPTSHLKTFENVLLAFGWGLGYLGQPHVLSKFLAIKDPEEIKKSMVLGLVWQAMCLLLASFIGVLGLLHFSSMANAELIFVELVKSFFHPFIGGLILCGVLAAALSTLDSQIMVVSSVISENFSALTLKKAKLVTMGVLLLAYLIALSKSSTVSDLVFFAWNGLGCVLGPVLLVSFYVKNVHYKSVMVGIVFGVVASITLPSIMSFIPPMIAGYLISLSAFFVHHFYLARKI